MDDYFEHPEPDTKHIPTVHNWRLLNHAFATKSACIVRCTGPDKLIYNVLCKVVQYPHPKDHGTSCYYIPLGLMISKDLMPLMNQLQPPESLQCGWLWPPEESKP
jgi:hypothetical protein